METKVTVLGIQAGCRQPANSIVYLWVVRTQPSRVRSADLRSPLTAARHGVRQKGSVDPARLALIQSFSSSGSKRIR